MKKIHTYILLALTAVLPALQACQEEMCSDTQDGSPALNFAVNHGSEPSIAQTKTMTLTAGYGVTIPLTCTVEDGFDIPVAASTKGTQTNTTGSAIATNTKFTQFKVAAWNSDETSYIGAYETVSYANGKWSAANARSWEKSDVKTFYAFDNVNLPSGASISCTSADSQTLTYTVPTDVSAQKDILMGYYSGNGNKTGTAEIDFYHPLTAVVFKAGSGISDFQTLSISGVYTGGTITQSKTDTGCKFTWSGTGSQTLSQDLTADTDGDAFMGEPFIIMPQNLSSQPVTIKIKAKTAKTKPAGGGENPVDLSFTLNSSTWLPGKTNVYTLGYTEKNQIVFTVDGSTDDVDIEFTSNLTGTETQTIVIKSANGDGGKTAANYTAEYSIDGETWIAYDGSVTGVSGFGATNTGSKDGITISLVAQPRGEGQPVEAPWEDDDVEADGWDLSKCSIGGEYSASNAQNTANCYIVKHPGSYKFPCVYGNGLKNGSTNTSGYVFSGTKPNNYSSGGILETFLNAKGNAISSPWVLTDVSATNPRAALLWCDTKENGELLIQNVSLDGNYITFDTATNENMVQGNAVIVLYDDKDGDGAYDGGEGLWSWHIWVTDDDLSASNTGTVSGGYSFMSRNLGWAPGKEYFYAVQEQYSDYKEFQIRLQQVGSPNYIIINISQPDIYASEGATNTMYQFGRKDPFVGILDASNSKTMYGPDGSVLSMQKSDAIFPYTETGYAKDETGNSYRHNNASYAVTCVANSISNPDVYNTNTYVEGMYFNVWNTNLTLDNSSSGGFQSVIDYAVTKTIYDPSPYGYKVPEGAAIASYINNWAASTTFYYNNVGTWDSASGSYKLKNASGEYDAALVFPAAGSYTVDGVIDSSNVFGAVGIYHTAVSWHTYSSSSKQGTHGTQSMKFLIGSQGICIHGYTRGRACAVRPVLE